MRLSRSFINAHLRFGTKPLMKWVRHVPTSRVIANMYSKLMFRPSRGMSFAPDILEHEGRSVPMIWCSMQAKRADKVILYLHGGGYVIGGLASHGAMVAQIAGGAGVRAAVVEFRLAPEHPYPAAIEDAELAYRALLERGYRGSDIILAGDSAGGGMVFALLLRVQDSGLPLPAACVALSPLADLTLSGESYSKNRRHDVMLPIEWIKRSVGDYLGVADATAPDASPIFGRFRDPPPSLLICAEDELLASDSVRLRDLLQRAGGVVEFQAQAGLPHVWTLYQGKFQPADQSIARVAEFMRRHIGE